MYNKISNGVNKLLITFLAIIVLTLPACGKKTEENKNQDNSNTQINTEAENIPENNPPPLVNIVDPDAEVPEDPELPPEKEAETIIGGDTDVYGCLSAAGYSWCESKQICLRTWEQDCNPTGNPPTEINDSNRAGQIAREYFDQSEEWKYNNFNSSIINVTQDDCIGCWTVEFEYERDIEGEMELISVEVTLENWQVKK
jgi:hypothetical protein